MTNRGDRDDVGGGWWRPGPVGAVWAGSGRSGPVWTGWMPWAGLDRFGPVWTGLGWSELAWVVLGRLGPAGAALTDWTGWFGPVCGGPGGLDRSGRSGPAWTRFGAARLGGLAWSGQGGPVLGGLAGSGQPGLIKAVRPGWVDSDRLEGGGPVPAESTQRESFTSSSPV